MALKCDGCGKSAKTLFRKLLYQREYGCELMFYYCSKCYRKSKQILNEVKNDKEAESLL